MTSLENLQSNGFVLSVSAPCVVTAWGKWLCHFKRNDRHIAGYGDNEEAAFDDAYKTFLNNKEKP